MASSGQGPRRWTFGGNHSAEVWARRMVRRGWTSTQIDEAIADGPKYPATNLIRPGSPATRHVHPTTGRSVVIDDVTWEVIHVGGDGFLY